MPKTTEPTAGYDDAGNMTVYELAPGETLPPGVHPTPPPGTHPHEREQAQRETMMAAFLGDPAAATSPLTRQRVNIPPSPEPFRAENEVRGDIQGHMANSPDLPPIVKRGPGRPPKPRP